MASTTELLELCRTNQYDTDKFKTDNTIVKWTESKHSYVESAYGELFKRFRNTKSVLEIGIQSGGSHLLWKDYFPEASIVGMDINFCEKIHSKERIIQILGDAYTERSVNLFRDNYFDIIIDDGPHKLHTMKYAIENYLPKLTENGIMCIEDIVEYSWLYELSNLVPENLKECIKVFDLREEDSKSDSLLLVIDKGELNGKS